MCAHDLANSDGFRATRRAGDEGRRSGRRGGNGFLEERDIGASRIEWLTEDGVCAAIVRFSYAGPNALQA